MSRIPFYGKQCAIISLFFATVAMGHDGPHQHTHGEETHTHAVATGFNNEVSITIKGDYRFIQSNGIPEHETGRFPNRGNPNRISEQRHSYRVPVHPQVADRVTHLERQAFGVALNGVPFHPGTAEYWGRDRTGWNYEALSGKINLGLDENLAHVQPTGSYHYHGIPKGLLNKRKSGQETEQMVLLGYAADGFPIYGPMAHKDPADASSTLVKLTSSYLVKQGVRPDGPGGRYDGTFVQDYEYVQGLGDLDECNGRTGVTPEYPEGTYYYVLTETYPFIPRNFRGTPDPSFEEHGPPPGRGGPPGPPGRRPPRGQGPPPPRF